MGWLGDDGWFPQFSSEGHSRPTSRDEIPDWFYDHCYEVVRKPGDHDEDLKYIGSTGPILCYCSEDGWNPVAHRPQRTWVVEITPAMWERWQGILIVPPGHTPKEGREARIDHNASGDKGTTFIFRCHHTLCAERGHSVCEKHCDHDWRVEVKFQAVNLASV